MGSKKTGLDRAIDALEAERAALDVALGKLIAQRDAEKRRKPRTKRTAAIELSEGR